MVLTISQDCPSNIRLDSVGSKDEHDHLLNWIWILVKSPESYLKTLKSWTRNSRTIFPLG